MIRTKKIAIKIKNPYKFNVVYADDGNKYFTVKAESIEDAAFRALEKLGWLISEG